MINKHSSVETIRQNPQDYCACESCGSILMMASNSCPQCHGYRLDRSVDGVLMAVQKISLGTSKSISKEDMT